MTEQGPAGNRPADVEGVRDIRTARAKSVWDALGKRVTTVIPLEQYLDQIPLIPDFPVEAVKRLPYSVLIDPRFGLKDACRLGEIYFAGDDESYAHSKPQRGEAKTPFWTRMSVDIGLEKEFLRVKLSDAQAHATAVEGVFFLLQHPHFLKLHSKSQMLIAGGSRWPKQPGRPAYFKHWNYPPSGGNPTGKAVTSELALHQSDRGMISTDIPKLVRFVWS